MRSCTFLTYIPSFEWIYSMTTNAALGKIIDLLSLSLPPYIERVLAPHLNGVGWPVLLTELDKAKASIRKRTRRMTFRRSCG